MAKFALITFAIFVLAVDLTLATGLEALKEKLNNRYHLRAPRVVGHPSQVSYADSSSYASTNGGHAAAYAGASATTYGGQAASHSDASTSSFGGNLVANSDASATVSGAPAVHHAASRLPRFYSKQKAANFGDASRDAVVGATNFAKTTDQFRVPTTPARHSPVRRNRYDGSFTYPGSLSAHESRPVPVVAAASAYAAANAQAGGYVETMKPLKPLKPVVNPDRYRARNLARKFQPRFEYRHAAVNAGIYGSVAPAHGGHGDHAPHKVHGTYHKPQGSTHGGPKAEAEASLYGSFESHGKHADHAPNEVYGTYHKPQGSTHGGPKAEAEASLYGSFESHGKHADHAPNEVYGTYHKPQGSTHGGPMAEAGASLYGSFESHGKHADHAPNEVYGTYHKPQGSTHGGPKAEAGASLYGSFESHGKHADHAPNKVYGTHHKPQGSTHGGPMAEAGASLHGARGAATAAAAVRAQSGAEEGHDFRESAVETDEYAVEYHPEEHVHASAEGVYASDGKGHESSSYKRNTENIENIEHGRADDDHYYNSAVHGREYDENSYESYHDDDENIEHTPNMYRKQRRNIAYVSDKNKALKESGSRVLAKDKHSSGYSKSEKKFNENVDKAHSRSGAGVLENSSSSTHEHIDDEDEMIFDSDSLSHGPGKAASSVSSVAARATAGVGGGAASSTDKSTATAAAAAPSRHN